MITEKIFDDEYKKVALEKLWFIVIECRTYYHWIKLLHPH